MEESEVLCGEGSCPLLSLFEVIESHILMNRGGGVSVLRVSLRELREVARREGSRPVL